MVQIGYASDAELRWLYAHALGFVLPSHLEGFGIPAIEAVARGLVPIVSRHGALAEVTGPEALLVDPNHQEALERALSTLIAMPAAEKERRLKALRLNIRRFNPQRVRACWRAAITACNATGVAA